MKKKKEKFGSGGIRTHAIEMTGALNQRLRPLGHATTQKSIVINNAFVIPFRNKSRMKSRTESCIICAS